MITGSPYISNFSARKVVHAELTHTTYGACPVDISVAYDVTAHNNIKVVCTPSMIVATGAVYEQAYRPHAQRWGIIERKATAGDIVEVVIQGLIDLPNNHGSGKVGDFIEGFRVTKHIGSTTPTHVFGYAQVEQVDTATQEHQGIQYNMGVLVKEGSDGQAIVWQGVQTPNISDYSHGEAHRVQAKLQGTYDGGDGASISAGCPVVLYLDTNGDLLARGGHPIGASTDFEVTDGGYVSQADIDTRDSSSGRWGITETGGASGDVVDIVVAGHCQTSETTSVPNAIIKNIRPDGDLWCFSKTIISNLYDSNFGYNTDHWSAIGSTTVSVNGTITNKMKITTTTAGTAEGATLDNDEIENLEVGKTYIIGAAIDLLTTTDTPAMYFSVGGINSSTFNISNAKAWYLKEITITDTTSDIKLVTETSTAYEIEVDNVFIYEKDGYDIETLDADDVDNFLPNTIGTVTNSTGAICIFPGVNRYDIRDYKEQHIVTAKLMNESIPTPRKFAVSLFVDKNGKLRAIQDRIPASKDITGSPGTTTIPNNKWGLALDAGDDGDDIKVLVSGKVTDVDTTSDATWVAGDYLNQIGYDGKKERRTGFEYESIVAANDRSLESASNWAVYDGNSTSPTYVEDTGNNRIKITGSGNGSNTNDDGGAGREGAYLPIANLQVMEPDDTSMNTGDAPYRHTVMIQADVWYSGSGTVPLIGFSFGSSSSQEDQYYEPIFDDGTVGITTTQRTGRVFAPAAYAGASYDNLTIAQLNNSTLDWYFTDVTVTVLPHISQELLGMCLNADKKEWYLY